jgi:capsule polysaccharide export protein KpsE/RkpR
VIQTARFKLLCIEQQLGTNAVYAGLTALKKAK